MCFFKFTKQMRDCILREIRFSSDTHNKWETVSYKRFASDGFLATQTTKGRQHHTRVLLLMCCFRLTGQMGDCILREICMNLTLRVLKEMVPARNEFRSMTDLNKDDGILLKWIERRCQFASDPTASDPMSGQVRK